MNQSQAIQTFRIMAETIGDDATNDQVNRVVDWMREYIALDYVGHCADIAIESGCGDLFAAISEYMGECGL